MPSQQVTCEKPDCRNRFDPHRDPAAVGTDTWHWAFCGRSHDPRDSPEVLDQTSASDGVGEHVTVNIKIDEDGLNVGKSTNLFLAVAGVTGCYYPPCVVFTCR